MEHIDIMPTHSGLWTNFSHLGFDQAVDWVIKQTKIEMSRARREQSEEAKMAGACLKAQLLAEKIEPMCITARTANFQTKMLIHLPE